MRISKFFLYTLTAVLFVGCGGNADPDLPPETPEKPEAPKPELESTCNLTSLKLKASDNGLPKDIVFTLDKKSGTYSAMYLKWIAKDNPEMLIPVFTTDGESVWCGDRKVVSGKTLVSFADDFVLTVKAENGDKKEYSVSFNCPQINTELPVLRLQPETGIVSRDAYVKTKLDIYRSGSAEGVWTADDEPVDVRGRGNSTWRLPKKPYRIKFPVKFSPVGLDHAKAKSWVILAHDMDKSLLRNHLAFEISRILFNASENYHNEGAVMFTPCSQFVNVYMNDDYHGVYQMSDQMEVAKGRIDIDRLKAVDGSDASKITGGYLVETNIHHDEGYPVSFNSSRGIYMDHKYPKDDDCDIAQYRYMEDFIYKAESILYSYDFKDPQYGWRKWFDEKTLADYIIVKELAGDMDPYTLASFNETASRWETAAGTYNVKFGASCEDIRANAAFKLAKAMTWDVNRVMEPKVELNIMKVK